MKKIPIELEGEYLIRLIDLPVNSRGFVIYDDDDFANIYLNARLNDETRRVGADHEMDHVIHDDIHSTKDIRVIEARADKRERLLKAIPSLKTARDLIPKPKPREPKLTARQLRILKRAIGELDMAYFGK